MGSPNYPRKIRDAVPAIDEAARARSASPRAVDDDASIDRLLEQAMERIADARRLMHRALGSQKKHADLIEEWADGSEECARLSREIVHTAGAMREFQAHEMNLSEREAGDKYFRETLSSLEQQREHYQRRLPHIEKRLKQIVREEREKE